MYRKFLPADENLNSPSCIVKSKEKLFFRQWFLFFICGAALVETQLLLLSLGILRSDFLRFIFLWLTFVASLMTKKYFKICSNGHFAKWGIWMKGNPKFIEKSKWKSGKSKLGQKKNLILISLASGLLHLFFFYGVIKTIISQCFTRFCWR